MQYADHLQLGRSNAMQVHKNHRGHQSEPHAGSHAWRESGSDFVLVEERQPPPRIEMARERMLMCRLYIGLIRTLNEDYGAAFGSPSDSATARTIGIYVFLRTMMCSPVSASKIASSMKLPRVTVVRRLQKMVKHGFIERVGNAYRATDKVNLPDLNIRLRRRIDMIVETGKKLSELEQQRAA
jgi:hypothetical protein